MNTGTDGAASEKISVETQLGPVVIDLDGSPNDELTVTIIVVIQKLPKLFKALLPGNDMKIVMPRSLVRKYGQKLIDLSEAQA